MNFPELVLVCFRLFDSPRFLSLLDGHCHVLGLSGTPYGETSSPFWQLESKFSDQAEQLIQRERKPLAELRRKPCALPTNQTIQIVCLFFGVSANAN